MNVNIVYENTHTRGHNIIILQLQSTISVDNYNLTSAKSLKRITTKLYTTIYRWVSIHTHANAHTHTLAKTCLRECSQLYAATRGGKLMVSEVHELIEISYYTQTISK